MNENKVNKRKAYKNVNNNTKNIDVFSLVAPEEYKRKKDTLTSFFLSEEYVPLSKKQVIKLFDIKNNEKLIFFKILDELENEFLIYINEDSKILKLDSEVVKKCNYSAKSNKFGFAIPFDGSNDIYILSDNSLNAMDGDTVIVYITATRRKENTHKEGKVTKILKRNITKIYGKYIGSANFGFVEPLNPKINDIYLSKKNNLNIKESSIVEVEIIKYPTRTSRAEGKVISVIGPSNDDKVLVEALYKSYGLDKKEEFNSKILEELDKIPDSVSEIENKNRVDRREDKVFTIDSFDAMDLDDAISVKKENDKYILSVYIADVSYYVKDGTYLDKEAIARATSIYIPKTVIPMLPKKLSNGICSLNANVDRLALAVDMVIDNLGNVIDSNIFKAVINVKKKMTYENVYKVITKSDDKVLDEYKEYICDIDIMRELANILNKKRMENGSINFDIPETKVVLDDNNNVIDIKPYEITEANNIIEEFMLVTNTTVAERFFFMQAPFIYRIHEKPDEEKLRELNELLINYGEKIKGIKNVHPITLAKILDKFRDNEQKDIISKFMLRTLKLAKYSHECTGHFGLAFKYYCHFTSPIRRYPDLFIHRVISEYIDKGYNLDDRKIQKYSKQAEKYAIISSDMEKEATKIERDFDNLYEAIYMKDKVGQVFSAAISSITSFGMFVRIKNQIEGFVSFDSLQDDYYTYDEKKLRLIGMRTGNIYKIGDRVEIKLVKVDVRLKQIDFNIISRSGINEKK